MANDLISRNALIDRFKQLKGSDTLANMFVSDVIKEVKKQPTAYDVEKVVGELERWSAETEIILPISKDTIETKVIASGNAIDIVRRGGA